MYRKTIVSCSFASPSFAHHTANKLPVSQPPALQLGRHIESFRAAALCFVLELGLPACSTVVNNVAQQATPTVAAARTLTYFDGTTYPYTDAGLASIISVAGVGGQIEVPSEAVIAVTSPHLLPSGQHIVCNPGATFALKCSLRISI